MTPRPPSAEDLDRENETLRLENETLRQENEALRRRLAEAEQANEALTKGQVDAVVDEAHQVPLLLQQAQEALRESVRESEERYRVLFEGSPLPMYLFDQETLAIAAVNEAAVLHYGYSREEFLSKTLREIWHPDQGAGAMASHPASSGEPRSTVRRHAKKGGASITVEVFSHSVHFAGRSYRLSVIRDITQRRLAEEEMERIHSEYRLLLNSIGEGIHWIGVDRQIRFENPAGARMLGYEVSELIGKPAHLTIHHTRADGTPYPVDECVIYATLRDGVARHAKDEVFWRKDGTSFAVEYISTSIRDEKDRPAGTVVAFTDITERRQLEAQLLQAQKMEAVGRLAGGVAHDFNNILTVIGGYSEMLVKTLPEGEPSHRHVAEIGMAAKRAVALTRQLLAFSRKQVLEPKVLDLNTIVSGMLGLLSRLLGEDVEIVLELQKGLGLVKVDRGQIEQVIMNLAVNARDAMPDGGKLIFETQDVELDESYARAHPSVTAGPYVLFAASDMGCGMTPETVSHLFEPFFTTKEAGKGTGLGLSTVFGIVKQSGGEISVYSVPGEGTTFKIYLSRVGAETSKRDLGSSPAIVPLRTGQTVLMVEDDEAIGRLTQSMLGDLGYEVLAATRGEEALEIAAHHPLPIDLLLTDVMMPGMRGPEVAKRLLAVRPETRVVFMSGYAEELVLNQAAVQGPALFLAKPFTSSTLGRKLREALDAVPLPEQQGAGVHGGRKPLSILHMDDDRDILEITKFFLAEDGHRVVGCVDVEETVARYAEALARGERFDLVILDLSIPGKKGGVEGMREILKLDPTARIVACSGAGPSEVGPLESGFVGIVEKPFTSKSLKTILHLL